VQGRLPDIAANDSGFFEILPAIDDDCGGSCDGGEKIE